jgi:hypothetical protein
MSGSSSHAERALLLVALALSVAIVANVREPWIAREIFRRYDGTDYVQGMITLVAGVVQAGVVVAALVGLLPRRTAILIGLTTGAVAVALSLSLWVSLVGNADPRALDPVQSIYVRSGAEFMASTELWTASLLGATSMATFVALAMSSRLVERDVPNGGARVYALAFACTAFASVWMTWYAGTWWSNLGVERGEGLLTLLAAASGMLAASFAMYGLISPRLFAAWGLASGAALLAVPLWFYWNTIGDPDPAWDQTLIECFNPPCGRIEAGVGLMLAVFAGVGYLLAVAVTLLPDASQDRTSASNQPARA